MLEGKEEQLVLYVPSVLRTVDQSLPFSFHYRPSQCQTSLGVRELTSVIVVLPVNSVWWRRRSCVSGLGRGVKKSRRRQKMELYCKYSGEEAKQWLELVWIRVNWRGGRVEMKRENSNLRFEEKQLVRVVFVWRRCYNRVSALVIGLFIEMFITGLRSHDNQMPLIQTSYSRALA